jgi:hypothetical protein
MSKAAKPKRFARKATIAKHPGKLKSPAQAICDESQIEFRKLATGEWNILIHEPLASRVRQMCKCRKISARKFILDLLPKAE